MRIFIARLILLFLPFAGFAQSAPDTGWVRQNFTKSEVFITMRDGIKLFTVIYTPRESGKYPILMQRSPYSSRPYGADQYRQRLGPNTQLMKAGYIFVYQDVRGRYKSEGSFREMTPFIANKKSNKDVDESSDTYDTIEWLLANTPNNGRVGQYGISFPGFYSTASLPAAHPALKAVSPQAPMSDEFIGDDCYHNGAFFLLDNFGFYSGFDGPKAANGESYTPFFRARYSDAYQYFLKMGPLKNVNNEAFFRDSNSIWRQTVKNDTYNEFWQSRNIRQHLSNIKPAVLLVGGWFDAEDLFGALKTYAAIEKLSPGNNSRLVMGPWTHGAWSAPSWTSFGTYQFGTNLNQYYQDEIETPFFNYYLKDQGSFQLSEATVYETGSNQWKQYSTWPPAGSTPTPYYLQPAGGLGTGKPAANGGFSSYISDPAKPVPYTAVTSGGRNNEYMVEDQRFAARRPDVLVFETDTLSSDLTLTGEIVANLLVSMTGTDADFIVKLIDVWPDPSSLPAAQQGQRPTQMGGYQQMVRAEVFRGKFRNSFSKPEPFVPNKVEKVNFKLNEVAHTFKKGHRVMIQVQSSWFPLVDRNPNKFGTIANMDEKDFQKNTIKLYHDSRNSSYISLPVMNQ